jgi:hypothetical protein
VIDERLVTLTWFIISAPFDCLFFRAIFFVAIIPPCNYVKVNIPPAPAPAPMLLTSFLLGVLSSRRIFL